MSFCLQHKKSLVKMDPQHAGNPSSDSRPPPAYYEQAPPLPARTTDASQQLPVQSSYLVPPKRLNSARTLTKDISLPIHYTRDPHKLIAYLVPFLKLKLYRIALDAIPTRFLMLIARQGDNSMPILEPLSISQMLLADSNSNYSL